jgi:DNA-directed RNA polymerase
MSLLIWDALQETVVAAAQAMDWMQACARLIVGEGERPVRWTVPVTGFPVRQEYYTPRFDQIKTVIAGRAFKPSFRITTNEDLLAHRQINAVAPNVIHSLDAAVLMATVVLAREHGVTSFAMIHDSYGTVPADCSTLAKDLRTVFVQFYRDNDVVGHLFRCFLAEAPENTEKPLPEPPAMGTLDINAVMDSQYFFN